MRVSCLKFEPRVSNFPVLESEKADSSTAVTMGSPFFFFLIRGEDATSFTREKIVITKLHFKKVAFFIKNYFNVSAFMLK